MNDNAALIERAKKLLENNKINDVEFERIMIIADVGLYRDYVNGFFTRKEALIRFIEGHMD